MKAGLKRYAIRARFVGNVPAHLKTFSNSNVYLGKRGQWASLEKALRFKTQRLAESALQEKWQRLHNAGNKSVILSVVHV